MRTLTLIVFGMACCCISGCSAVSVAIATTKSTDRFLAYTPDPRVLYEPGGEVMARHVSEALSDAIRTVEQLQYREFVAPVRIYVCGSMESFRAYGAPGGREGGFVLNKRLFISPKPENTAERIPRILAHELSHLQIEQQIGFFNSARLPSWFKEGLAVYVSKGGGAENVTETRARIAIQQNEYFEPETEGSLFFPMRAHDYGLTPHLFYREAGMFIAYMNHLDGIKFRTFLLAVEDGVPLATAFNNAYGLAIGTIWGDFLARMQNPGNAFDAVLQQRCHPALLPAGCCEC